MRVRSPSSLGPALPAEWEVTPLAAGGVRMNIRQDARPALVVVPILLATAWLVLIVRAAMSGTALPLGITQPMALGIDLALVAFATWCGLAVETWEVGADRLEHRLVFGALARVRRVRPGTLTVRTGTDNHGWAYYRLYVVDAAGRDQWVMDRNRTELAAMAAFLGFHTGWPVVPEGGDAADA